MSTLTDFFPTTTAVKLGQKSFTVGQLTLRDVAQLQSFVEEENPHPYCKYREKIQVAEGEVRDALLMRCQREDLQWPPLWSGARSGKQLLQFLQLVLSKHNDITLEEVIEIASNITSKELQQLDSVVYHFTDRDEFIALHQRPKQEKPWERVDNWGEIIHGLINRYGFTIDQIGDLTLSQYHLLMTQGKPKALPVMTSRAASYEEVCAEMERQRWLLELSEVNSEPQ